MSRLDLAVVRHYSRGVAFVTSMWHFLPHGLHLPPQKGIIQMAQTWHVCIPKVFKCHLGDPGDMWSYVGPHLVWPTTEYADLKADLMCILTDCGGKRRSMAVHRTWILIAQFQKKVSVLVCLI